MLGPKWLILMGKCSNVWPIEVVLGIPGMTNNQKSRWVPKLYVGWEVGDRGGWWFSLGNLIIYDVHYPFNPLILLMFHRNSLNIVTYYTFKV